MNSQVLDFTQLLGTNKQLTVPLFQRSYCWKKEEWEILWQDILERCEGEESAQSHFVGAIVTIPSKCKTYKLPKELIIDGQQRLTTVSILLAVIRDYAKDAGYQMDENNINRYLLDPYNQGYEALRILPTNQDREIFYKIIDGKLSSAGLANFNKNSLIYEAYKHFKKLLPAKDNDGNEISLDALLKVILHELVTVHINLSSNDNPYLIFHSLNDKGVKLTQADLIRNHLMMQFNDEEQNRLYSNVWKPLEERLGEDLSEFIRYYLIKDGRDVNKNAIYETVKNRLNNGNTDAIVEEMENLQRFVAYYDLMDNPTQEKNPHIRDHFTFVKIWKVGVYYPLLLKLYDDYLNSKLSQDEFIETLQLIESFVIRRYFCKIPTNSLKTVFLELCKNYPSGNIREYIKETLLSYTKNKKWPNDSEFKRAFGEFSLYTAQKAKQCQYILTKIEKSYYDKEHLEYTNFSIEHIIPQTLTDLWKNELTQATIMTHDRWKDSIGNLTLTAVNAELSNKTFSEKKRIYQKTNLNITKNILMEPTWNKSKIEKRAEKLFDRAKEIWVYPKN